MKKRSIEKYILAVFIILAMLEGMMFSVLTPAGKNPDEYTHFAAMADAWGLSAYNEVADTYYHDTGVYDITITSDQKVDRALYEQLGMQENTIGLPIGQIRPHLGILKFIPQSIGFLIAAALHLPILPMLQLMELICLLCYVLCGVLTLKLMPYKKHIMLFCMLLPMTMHQVASINYDTELMACSFLLIALILNIKANEEKTLRWRHVLAMLVLTFLIAYVKAVYALILLLALTIPFTRYQLKIGRRFELGAFLKRFRIPVILLFLAGICAGIYRFRFNPFVNILLSCIFQPRRTLVVLLATLRGMRQAYLYWYAGSFGALDVNVEPWFLYTLFLVMLLCILFHDKQVDKTASTMTIRTRLLMLFIFASIFVLVFISMFAWSLFLANRSYYISMPNMQLALYSIDLILGVQGRYFIPITPLIMLPLSGIIKQISFRKVFYTGFTIYLIGAMLYVTKVMLFKFWI